MVWLLLLPHHTATPEQVAKVLLAVEEGFLRTDKEFIDDAVKDDHKWKDGATAVIALFLHNHLLIANLGDSEAVIG